MAGRLTAQSKEIILLLFRSFFRMSGKGDGGSKSQMMLGELPRPAGFQGDRWSEHAHWDGFHGRACSGKVRAIAKRKTVQDTPQAFHKKCHSFLNFQAIFFLHISKKLHCSNLFKNVWITRFRTCYYFTPKKVGARNFEIDYSCINIGFTENWPFWILTLCSSNSFLLKSCSQ